MWSAPFCKKFSHPFSAFPTQRCPPHLESRTPSLPPAPSLVPWPQSHQQEEEAAGKRAELSGLIFKHSACRQQRRALGGFPAGRVSDGQARLQPLPPLPPPPPAGASSIPVSPPSSSPSGLWLSGGGRLWVLSQSGGGSRAHPPSYCREDQIRQAILEQNRPGRRPLSPNSLLFTMLPPIGQFVCPVPSWPVPGNQRPKQRSRSLELG